MKRTPLRKVSQKQAEKNRIWNEITDEVCEKSGYICFYCGKKGQRDNPDDPRTYLDGHHIIKRRFNIHTKENCYPCHRAPCHREIEDKNIIVSIGDYKTRELFL